MNNISGLCADYADSNPDISGVGVRVSFYLQTFLLVLLVDRSWQDAPIALWTFIATSAGLTVAAICQREHLTLFQALQVSNLVWLANFGTFFALASYSRQKAASNGHKNSRRAFDYKVKFGAMTQTLLSMALTLYMWASAETFGNLSECAHLVRYMLFVIEVPAIQTGRIVGLVITTILTTLYILITLRELQSYRQSYLDTHRKVELLPTQTPSTPSTVAEPIIPPQPLPRLLLPSSATLNTPERRRQPGNPRWLTTSPSSPHTPRSHKGRPKRRRWSSDLDPMLVGIIICQVMVFTYFIVSTELLLKRNPSDDDSVAQWSFGQILALIVVIPSAFSLAGAISEHGVKRLSKRKKRLLAMKDVRSRKRKQDIEIV
ncbi:hypothetical protein Hypma_015823 [Hypsizygus marmoreus]|uniref:Uncharacterized protein n=1 Tax=Hypsizygus marmoreus TaxID=39966 RepID=A0A369KBM6_HYPMA|nr:hypothetical protein Hypma_015823 [Hypsizygus marmoreus]